MAKHIRPYRQDGKRRHRCSIRTVLAKGHVHEPRIGHHFVPADSSSSAAPSTTTSSAHRSWRSATAPTSSPSPKLSKPASARPPVTPSPFTSRNATPTETGRGTYLQLVADTALSTALLGSPWFPAEHGEASAHLMKNCRDDVDLGDCVRGHGTGSHYDDPKQQETRHVHHLHLRYLRHP